MVSLLNLTIGAAMFLSMLVLSAKIGHARFMNAARRFAALWFISLGSLAFVGTVASTIWPDAFAPAPRSTSGDVGLIVISGLVVAFGIWLIRTPSYRPDLGDTMRLMSTEPWAEELARRGNRAWWTGDPKPTSEKLPNSDRRAI
jgi:hypothetical protein